VTGIVPSRWVASSVARTYERPWLAVLPRAALLLLLVPAIGLSVRQLRDRRRGCRPLIGRYCSRCCSFA